MATAIAPFSVSGVAHLKTNEAWSAKSSSFVKTSVITIPRKMNHQGTTRNFSIRAEYNDQRHNGAIDFIAGFLVGGAICGALGYVCNPEIKRRLVDENEQVFRGQASEFRRVRRPGYYYDGYDDDDVVDDDDDDEDDDGLEKTRQVLSEKIGQLNSAIDNVYSRLRGSNNKTPPQVPMESTDPKEATT